MEERKLPFSIPKPPLPTSILPQVYPNQVHPNQSQDSDHQLIIHINNNNGTYVIQVPRDQVYRVPPPENASMVEKYQNSNRTGNKKRQCRLNARTILYIAIALGIGCLLIGIHYILNMAYDPKFVIQHFNFDKETNPSTYNIGLQVYNPNLRAGLSYKDGRVSLLWKQQEIAEGAFPHVFQEHGSSIVMRLALRQCKCSVMPKEIQESMTNVKKKVHVTFSLSMKFHAQATTWKLSGWKKKYHVLCRVTVDTLTKDTHVLSQDCQTPL
ncbi:hypothetical protein PIB30_022595 [Stylosanthes scabra]|uniref:Late embryogenesis abundant protein LEA-2 subgroup domain-containing protein n=1 Tax=Stylosanthes scabra TaxID=79078 RepID=A0ABU6Q8X9_9FABA|nr:hypothetical protein [Stylosanthes scabra]